MLNKAILALSANAKPGTGPGLAHANQSLVCLIRGQPSLAGRLRKTRNTGKLTSIQIFIDQHIQLSFFRLIMI
jgi:hypothetical protein